MELLPWNSPASHDCAISTGNSVRRAVQKFLHHPHPNLETLSYVWHKRGEGRQSKFVAVSWVAGIGVQTPDTTLAIANEVERVRLEVANGVERVRSETAALASMQLVHTLKLIYMYCTCFACTRIHTRPRTHMRMHTHVLVCILSRTHTHAHNVWWVRVCRCLCVCVCVCYVCFYMCAGGGICVGLYLCVRECTYVCVCNPIYNCIQGWQRRRRLWPQQAATAACMLFSRHTFRVPHTHTHVKKDSHVRLQRLQHLLQPRLQHQLQHELQYELQQLCCSCNAARRSCNRTDARATTGILISKCRTKAIGLQQVTSSNRKKSFHRHFSNDFPKSFNSIPSSCNTT